jgi:hypothetical protein
MKECKEMDEEEYHLSEEAKGFVAVFAARRQFKK